jgi:hypothetical protein
MRNLFSVLLELLWTALFLLLNGSLDIGLRMKRRKDFHFHQFSEAIMLGLERT